ncbi:MAG: addiction module protein [Methylophilaceae bacterium]
MSSSLVEVEQQARMLSSSERAYLAETLLETLQNGALTDVETEWQAEIESRVAAYDRGETETFAAEDVFAEAKRIVR